MVHMKPFSLVSHPRGCCRQRYCLRGEWGSGSSVLQTPWRRACAPCWAAAPADLPTVPLSLLGSGIEMVCLLVVRSEAPTIRGRLHGGPHGQLLLVLCTRDKEACFTRPFFLGTSRWGLEVLRGLQPAGGALHKAGLGVHGAQHTEGAVRPRCFSEYLNVSTCGKWN